MPTDTILTWADYADERKKAFDLPKSVKTYRQYLEFLYRLHQVEEPPVVPDTMDMVPIMVNVGRWLWQCPACRSAIPVEPSEPFICYQCGEGGWMLPNFPLDKTAIEEELLKQPGRRLAAPIRHWRPGWTMEDLEGRTRMAAEAVASGKRYPRSLSIGSARLWAGGEVLTASNMNTFISDNIDDLAGRNGRVDFEDGIRVKDGTSPTTQPFLDLDESYVGLPLRTSDPASGEGRFSYRSDIKEYRANKGSGWYSLAQYTDLLTNGEDMTPGTELTVNLPIGDTFGSYRWMQVVLGASDGGVSDTILVPVSLIPSGPFDSILYMVDSDTDRLYTVNVTTGVATALPNGLGVTDSTGLASHGGVLYMVDSGTDRLYTVNVTTGVATALPNALGVALPLGLASHGGILYMVDSDTDRLYTVNVTTGVATALPNALGVTNPSGLASHGGVLYMVDSGTDRLYTVNVTTGVATALPNALGVASPLGLASHGGILYMVDILTDRLYTVNVTTGVATALPNGLGVTDSTGLASHGADDGFNVNPWLLIARNSTTQIRILPLQVGHLHDLIGIT